MDYRAEISKLTSELSTLTKRITSTDQECISLRDQLHRKVPIIFTFLLQYLNTVPLILIMFRYEMLKMKLREAL